MLVQIAYESIFKETHLVITIVTLAVTFKTKIRLKFAYNFPI